MFCDMCAENFTSSQFFPSSHQHILVNPYFLGVVRKQVSLGYPNRNPHIRTYRGIFPMYFWYSKKKGVNVGKSRNKKMCQDQNCVATTGAFWPNYMCRHLAVAATLHKCKKIKKYRKKHIWNFLGGNGTENMARCVSSRQL